MQYSLLLLDIVTCTALYASLSILVTVFDKTKMVEKFYTSVAEHHHRPYPNLFIDMGFHKSGLD